MAIAAPGSARLTRAFSGRQARGIVKSQAQHHPGRDPSPDKGVNFDRR